MLLAQMANKAKKAFLLRNSVKNPAFMVQFNTRAYMDSQKTTPLIFRVKKGSKNELPTIE